MNPKPPPKSPAAPGPLHHVVQADRVPSTGIEIRIEPGPELLPAIAKAAGIPSVERFEAVFHAEREGSRVRVRGRVTAAVTQECVVTLEPVAGSVAEDVHLVFAPPDEAEAAARAVGMPEDEEAAFAAGELGGFDLAALDDPDLLPDPFDRGGIDFGALALEALVLGLDLYPRKPGAVFQEPAPAGEADGPLAAALAALKAKG